MISATEGKEPDHIQDEDLRTPEQLRGDMKDIIKAKETLMKTATFEGLATEVQVIKQQIEKQGEQMNRLIGMYGTLQQQFDQYNQQRIAELNMKVNHGSTSPEDD